MFDEGSPTRQRPVALVTGSAKRIGREASFAPTTVAAEAATTRFPGTARCTLTWPMTTASRPICRPVHVTSPSTTAAAVIRISAATATSNY
jgi:hypothetical protein